MKKYQIRAITTLEGEPKTDQINLSRVDKVGYVNFCTVNKESSCMMFILDDGGYTSFITSAIVDIEEELTRNYTQMIVTTQNSIYILRTIEGEENICD